MRFLRDEAPIIIHVAMEKTLHFLVSDSHYRNQFETSTSGGSTNLSMSGGRRGWESRLFNKLYDSSTGFDRVKYGVLNIVKDPAGIASCSSYGESYMVLKNVRLRTTFADQDSSSASASLATCEYYSHVLTHYTDAELKAVMEVALGRSAWRPSTSMGSYKEVQIHGEVRLKDHVECLVVPWTFKVCVAVVCVCVCPRLLLHSLC